MTIVEVKLQKKEKKLFNFIRMSRNQLALYIF